MTERKHWEDMKFGFFLYINGHIVCQRNFDIRKYNDEILKSQELKDLMDRLVGMNNGDFGELGLIPNFLKEKSKEYLYKRYNPYIVQASEDIRKKNIFEKEDIFTFEIKVDDRVVAQQVFSGNYFPTQVRYNVNIKSVIPTVVKDISETFSRKKYGHLYPIQYHNIFI